MTDAESRLWYNLRRHGLANFKFRRQHAFGPYIFDFYCPEGRLVVEVDGGQHFDEANLIDDVRRTQYLEAHGLKVLRFTNIEALQETDLVLNTIFEALETPLPLPSGARGQPGGLP